MPFYNLKEYYTYFTATIVSKQTINGATADKYCDKVIQGVDID